ncbi:Hsp90 cochaperone shq1 [Terramyces sp. JEL0728]|nr:Hsp90 cochaperone shq1 [Terramyces sp. JEL0728]
MLTPVFAISQDEEYIIIEMKCPYIKAQSVEIDVNDKEFRFYGKPYFLRLHFSRSLVENGREKSSYNTDTGVLLLHIPKAEEGQHFEDLDLLTKLMDIKEKPAEKKILIEEISEPNPAIGVMAVDEQEEFDWNHPQEIPTIQTSTNYGFNNLYSGLGPNINELARDIIDIKDLDTSSFESRRDERLTMEELKFDDEYYMHDCVMNEEIPTLLEFKPEPWKILKKIQKQENIQAHESMYLIDRVYITDYCVWIQKASDKQIKSLASELHHFEFNRELSGWQLQELEETAKQHKEQES